MAVDEWTKAMAERDVKAPPKTLNGQTMNRTDEWIVEAARRRIGQRQIDFNPTITPEHDIFAQDEETAEVVEFKYLAWGNPDNSDRSVREWVNRRIDRWLAKIALRRKELKSTNAEFESAGNAPSPKLTRDEAIAELGPAQRKRGRPPKVKPAEVEAVQA